MICEKSLALSLGHLGPPVLDPHVSFGFRVRSLIFMTRKHELNVYAGSIDCSCTGALAIALEHSSWHRLQNGLACNIHTTAAKITQRFDKKNWPKGQGIPFDVSDAT